MLILGQAGGRLEFAAAATAIRLGNMMGRSMRRRDRRLRDDAGTEASELLAFIYRPKARGVVVQAALVLVVALVVWWIIVAATAGRSDAQGGFDFLEQASNVAVAQSAGAYLLGYQQGVSTNLDLYLVGLINTLAVSGVAIVAASVIGATMGLFLVVPNFVLRTVATLYIQAFRHAPLLLQMLIWYTLGTQLLPSAGADSLQFERVLFLDTAGLRAPFPDILPGGGALWIILLLFVAVWQLLAFWARLRKDRTGKSFPTGWAAFAALICMSIVGYYLAGFYSARNAVAWYQADFQARGELKEDPRLPVSVLFQETSKVEALFECAPTAEGRSPYLLAQLSAAPGAPEILLGRYHTDKDALRAHDPATAQCVTPTWLPPVQWEVPAPTATGFVSGIGAVISMEMLAVLLGLTLYSGAFIAETVRAGLMAAGAGQLEAADALGLQRHQALGLIIGPQAVRAVMPPLMSQYLSVIQNSSLATVVFYPDLVRVFTATGLKGAGHEIETLALTMLTYLTFAILIRIAVGLFRRREAIERTRADT